MRSESSLILRLYHSDGTLCPNHNDPPYPPADSDAQHGDIIDAYLPCPHKSARAYWKVEKLESGWVVEPWSLPTDKEE